ncbi:hypothetical protein HA402_006946 [Bradysia odoriphaga]|nr:hypothetical protein HA402_006946 [Bradysia odoriphaga]
MLIVSFRRHPMFHSHMWMNRTNNWLTAAKSLSHSDSFVTLTDANPANCVIATLSDVSFTCVDESNSQSTNCIEVETANRPPTTDKVSEPKDVTKHIFTDENVSFTFVDDAVSASTSVFEEFDDVTDEMILNFEF